MQLRRALTAGGLKKLLGRSCIVALATAGIGAGQCTENPGSGNGAVPPSISVTLNGVPDDMNDLLVVPPSGFVINVAWQQGTYPVDLAEVPMYVERWGAPDGQEYIFSLPVAPGASQASGVFPGNIAPGTYSLRALVYDVHQNYSYVFYDFAVRAFQGSGAPPIGSGQQIWFDFQSDRDAVPGPDFPVDLQAFGLGSAASPALSQYVLGVVTDLVLARVEEAYHLTPTNGLAGPDPVAVSFSDTDPGAGDVTRICVGGEAPGGSIGSILTDPNNSNRSSVECGTLPPTGIFPRGLVGLAGDPDFQAAFDGLRPATGGIPAGEHPLDPIVLNAAFVPSAASPQELARYVQLANAVTVFADMLGSIVAHETGHALGLVPIGAPGGGLFGGGTGATVNHDVTPAGVTPSENFLMNAGNSFNVARLAGLNGNPLPFFRALDYAYLRDRVAVDAAVTVLAYPPVATSVSPTTIILPGYNLFFVNGSGFFATPSLRLISPGYIYNATGELLLSPNQVRGWVNHSQILPGVYDVELRNPDGQKVVLPAALTVTPL